MSDYNPEAQAKAMAKATALVEQGQNFLKACEALQLEYPEFYEEEPQSAPSTAQMRIPTEAPQKSNDKKRKKGSVSKMYNDAIMSALSRKESINTDDVIREIKEMTGETVERARVYTHMSRERTAGRLVKDAEKYGYVKHPALM